MNQVENQKNPGELSTSQLKQYSQESWIQSVSYITNYYRNLENLLAIGSFECRIDVEDTFSWQRSQIILLLGNTCFHIANDHRIGIGSAFVCKAFSRYVALRQSFVLHWATQLGWSVVPTISWYPNISCRIQRIKTWDIFYGGIHDSGKSWIKIIENNLIATRSE